MWRGNPAPGFTVLELLIAASLTTLLAGLAAQGTFEYFRLKQGLLLRTELRHAVQAVQARVSSTLQQAISLLPLTGGGYILVLPQDRDRCGYVCALDRYQVLRWEVVPEAGRTGASYLREVRTTTRAFRLPVSEAELQPVFAKAIGRGERVASGVTALIIEPERDRFYNTVIKMQREGPRGGGPVTLASQEFVALRSQPRQEDLPDLAALSPGKISTGDASHHASHPHAPGALEGPTATPLPAATRPPRGPGPEAPPAGGGP
ncbi:MAG: hypothetical protein VKS61_14990 [Candidatus Sericytochromatia bacterium]|nr:hypothetical protein [Candidatus Sericytochromatia bacterium]